MLKAYYEESGTQIHHGDNRKVLTVFESDSVDSVVTDPPYEQGFMGKAWDKSGIAYDVNVWRECLRVLKPGGYLLAFGGSRTYHRLACAIEDAGFEIRDQIQWIYGSGFPKSLDVSKAIDKAAGAEREVVANEDGRSRYDGATRTNSQTLSEGYGSITGRRAVNITAPATKSAKQWEGWGTALKPSHEPIVLARKPLIGTVAENVLRHGTGGLNIDGCRISADWKTDPTRRGWQGRNLSHDGGAVTFVDHNKQESQPHDLGRWPANVIHDGSDEVLSAFPDAPGQMGALNGGEPSRPAKNVYGEYKDRREFEPRLDSGSAARFFYCAKASKEDRDEGLEDLPQGNDHPTVKPVSLMRYLCRLVTQPGGTVLDPFLGSGSTGKAAYLEGLRFIGIDRDEAYCELAAKRCVLRQRSLFEVDIPA